MHEGHVSKLPMPRISVKDVWYMKITCMYNKLNAMSQQSIWQWNLLIKQIIEIDYSPQTDNLNLLVQIKFLNLFLYIQTCSCGHFY